MGVAVGQLGAPRSFAQSWYWLLFSVFAANAADLDFFPGLLAGDMNVYHHAATHSFGAAAMFALIVWAVARRFSQRAGRIAVLGGLIYTSHVLVDYITEDSRSPYGIPLFWPFSNEYYISPWTILGGVKHGVPGDSLATVMGHIFSWHNLKTLGLEAIVIVPVLVVIWWINRIRAQQD